MSNLPSTLYRLYRVRDWLHFLPLPLAGWFAEGTREPLALAGGILGLAFGLAYTAGINNAFDDRLDRGGAKNPVGRALPRRRAIWLSLPAAALSLACVALLSPQGLVPCAVLLAAATLYSVPPRLKRVPLLGTVWNLVIGVPGLFLAGSPDWGAFPAPLLAVLFALLLLVSQLLHEAADRDEDRAGGIATLGTLLGVRGTLALATALVAAAPAAAWALGGGGSPRLVVTVACGVFAAAWALVFSRRPERLQAFGLRRLRLAYRFSALALGMLVFFAARY